MKRIILSIFTMMLLTATADALAICLDPPCGRPVPVDPPETPEPSVPPPLPATSFVIGSYNIHAGRNAPGRFDINKTAAEIYAELVSEGAEVVVLQEVTSADQPLLYNQLLDAPLENGSNLAKIYPNHYHMMNDIAILSKWPFASSWWVRTDSRFEGKQPVYTPAAEIVGPNGNFIVYGVHLMNDGYDRWGVPVNRGIDRWLESQDIVNSILTRNKENLPVVVMGDMNDSETDMSMGYFALHLNGPTKADNINFDPYAKQYEEGSAIDYAFSSPGSYTEQLKTPDNLQASDHPPALFRWYK